MGEDKDEIGTRTRTSSPSKIYKRRAVASLEEEAKKLASERGTNKQTRASLR